LTSSHIASVLRVLDLVGRDHPRPDRAEGVAALALVPGAAALELVLALGDVVDDAVAGDVLERVGLVDVARLCADDDAELDLPVALDRVLRQHDGVVAADDALVGFMKMIGSFGIAAPVSAAWSE
jgi:hypothetical protein